MRIAITLVAPISNAICAITPGPSTISPSSVGPHDPLYISTNELALIKALASISSFVLPSSNTIPIQIHQLMVKFIFIRFRLQTINTYYFIFTTGLLVLKLIDLCALNITNYPHRYFGYKNGLFTNL